MTDRYNESMNFTQASMEKFYGVVDHEYFQDKDADLIYESLEKILQPISFGKYLQRYIFRKAGMEGHSSEVPLSDYQAIIIDSFRDHHTPASFTPTTSKLSALSKNWLTQQTVKRQVVLLLGFGLGMSTDDVNEFLYKALHEAALDTTDPFEMMCLYCYEHGYGYYKFDQLRQMYDQLKPDELDMKPIYEAQPAGRLESIPTIQDDAKLMTYLCTLKGGNGISKRAEAAYQRFMKLYDEAREVVAADYNQISKEETDIHVEKLREHLGRSDKYYEEDKQIRLRRAENARKVWTRDDISEADLEHILCSSIPVDQHGNLTPAKKSSLNAQFEGKRFSRKHINDLLRRNCEIDRFDLITLNFLIHAEQVDQNPNAQKRYIRFIESTNQILNQCGMGPLYETNPYECFILMCILSVSPLETYVDVMEMSYEESDR